MLALITGASSGIGKDMARELAKLNYDLVLVARNENELQKVKTNLEKEYWNIQISTYAYDLSVKENCYELFQKVNHVDILINNAGFGLFGKFTQTDLEKEVHMIETNVMAVHILTKLYLKEMQSHNAGHILNVASFAGFMPGPLMATYYATKNYVVSLTRAIHKELKKDHSHVQISLLCPGPVDTNFNQVANVKFKVDGLSSKYVAKYAIQKMLKGKMIIVPGNSVRMARKFCEVIPDTIKEELAYHVQTKKEGK